MSNYHKDPLSMYDRYCWDFLVNYQTIKVEGKYTGMFE